MHACMLASTHLRSSEFMTLFSRWTGWRYWVKKDNALSADVAATGLMQGCTLQIQLDDILVCNIWRKWPANPTSRMGNGPL